MERRYPSIEFEADIEPDGSVLLPRGVAVRVKPGERVTVKLTQGIVSRRLRTHNVTEEELERIANLQLEDREHVIRFLESEGTLAGVRHFKQSALPATKGRA